MQEKADFGLVGLAVMGENLVLNIESRGFTVAVYNRYGRKSRPVCSGPGKGEENSRRSYDIWPCGVFEDATKNHVDGQSREAGR